MNFQRKYTISPTVALGQHKNKYNFINLCHHFEDFGVAAEWHFFATSHGKIACDGIRGTVKRMVTKASYFNLC